MGRLVWPVVVLLLTSACAGVGDRGKAKLTREQIRQRAERVRQESEKLDALEDELETVNAEAVAQKQKVQETRRKLERVREAKRKLKKQYDEIRATLDDTEQLLEELLRRLGGPSPQDEMAAQKLLIVAKHFRHQNPTEARSVVAGKYKKVFERYPGAKAAKEAKKIYEEIMK